MNVDKLESAIARSGKSKVEIAKLCGTTRQTINAMLRGADFGVSRLEKFAHTLNIPVGYFFDGVEDNGAKSVEIADLEKEIKHLKDRLTDVQKLLAYQEQLIASKDSQLQDKERLIQLLMQQK
jgi:transcriptional regulator with XRE-family HTH domain